MEWENLWTPVCKRNNFFLHYFHKLQIHLIQSKWRPPAVIQAWQRRKKFYHMRLGLTTSNAHHAICIAFVAFSFPTPHDVSLHLAVGRISYPYYCYIDGNPRKTALECNLRQSHFRTWVPYIKLIHLASLSYLNDFIITETPFIVLATETIYLFFHKF